MRDAITLSNSELMELTRRANSRTDRAEDARRARLILLLAEATRGMKCPSASTAAGVL